MLRAAAGLMAVLIAGTAGLARYFLRGILRVTRSKDYDIPVLGVGTALASGTEDASGNNHTAGHNSALANNTTPGNTAPDSTAPDSTAPDSTVQLVATENSLLPGTYGMSWLDAPGNPTGQAIVGPILSVEGDLGRRVKRGRAVRAVASPVVTRALVDVRAGELRVGLRTAWEQYVYLGDPGAAHGLDFLDLELPGDLGAYPTWLLPGDSGPRWVIAVHGRGASRNETMRILPTLATLGLPTLIPSYRNDVGAPATADNRYRLGDTEWQEIDAAMAYAIEHGATELVLYGWSMGAAIVLQATARSSRADSVLAMILDSPVIDWRDTLRANARVNRLPRPAAELGLWMVQRQLGINLDDFDWVARADELTRPMLIFHGPEDAFVPWERALALAKARPDLVSMVTYQGAGHTKSWNVDPAGYEREVRDFLRGLG